MTTKAYFEKLVSTFPELKDSLWDWEDGDTMIHYNMERFADFTIEQIKSSNWLKLKDCFDFQEEAIKSINPEIENALYVSYCEALLLSKEEEGVKSAIKYMGPLLKSFLIDYEKYYNDLPFPDESPQQ